MEYIYGINDQIIQTTDSRVKNWLFMESVFPTLSILTTYYFCIIYGPKFMENRKPFNLKAVLLLYNIAMIILSTYLFFELLIVSIQGGYNLDCQLPDYSDNPFAIRMARGHWLYFITKLIELLDTIFFVLRKKNNQISTLHVFHHLIMPFSWHFIVRYLGGGSVFFLPMINSFVHILMYGYYCLSALGPAIQPYLWWKKYLTKIQMTQFAMIIIHTGYNLLRPSCRFPKFVMVYCIIITSIVAVLFGNFYYQNYIKNNSKRNANNNNNTKSKKRQ
ncbi:elongation of very long chain fatty acids protein 7 [Patella vulgata]|uniref:elongation of very long chain fatty acids protein 7 n=1 Tax=Patella vulgata TaxID=6465 RepID=UPI00217F98FB|nr:elongation of very long chain fatty acids protein 7 [Patella vulgata]XP_050400550.1 elongation of very long chain fatty acids protein 7 [Patella vulgata]XP_050400551.1 elongation of very long chain fatty acids protein 7 [Patella vulgata]